MAFHSISLSDERTPWILKDSSELGVISQPWRGCCGRASAEVAVVVGVSAVWTAASSSCANCDRFLWTAASSPFAKCDCFLFF